MQKISFVFSIILVFLELASAFRFIPPSSFVSSRRPIKSQQLNRNEFIKDMGRMNMMSVVEDKRNTYVPKPSTPLSKHPDLVEGKLDNGFTYIILPNKVPESRFEAHLEILAGSANELERQQGMAHLLEHVSYMGSPKRQLISGTGSRTNAYTDFHHTVFFAACPTYTPDAFFKKPMLPMAFDALIDVMTTTVDNERLEKERAAVLSEASMVNKMEYRVECQVLSALHTENRISARFPIGKEDLIKQWKRDDVQLFHSIHYRPDNVILYVIGDVDIPSTIETIKQKFGGLKPKIDSQKLLKESGEFPDLSMRQVSRHFPPVIHRWSTEEAATGPNIPIGLVRPKALDNEAKVPVEGGYLPVPRIFKHELLQSFSFHLFAKRPIEPVVSKEALRRDIMRKMALSALQIRYNVLQRQDPLFTFIDFNQMNWPREGCAVCSLDLTTDASRWRDAVRAAIIEIRRLGLFGLTEGELVRYKTAILMEAEQLAAQATQMDNENVIESVMEAESCGHTYMHPEEKLEATFEAIENISLEDINEISRELCEHLSHMQSEEGVKPSAVLACCPVISRDGSGFSISEKDVADVISEALGESLTPLEETLVPDTLISRETLLQKASVHTPKWVPVQEKVTIEGKNKLGIVQKMLSNGIKVNMFSMKAEPQKAMIRLYVPGGRMLESAGAQGAVYIGSRTMQEGGAFANVSREEVELFCIDHNVMVEILSTDDALIFDFQSVTSPGPGGVVTGIEACMQVAHIILTDFKYEQDAFERARQSGHEAFDSVVKGLESACQETIALVLSNKDTRRATPDHHALEALDLKTVTDAMVSQLNPDSVEVSISGDLPMEILDALALNYLGTVPPRASKLNIPKESLNVAKLGSQEQSVVYLPDSDERAMGYVAGPCPNQWGVFADGSTVSEKLIQLNGNKKDDRISNPIFSSLLLQVFQEVANRRLFAIVREERRLTYDASFQLMGADIIQGGYYLVSVTSSPSQVQQAVSACKESLQSLKGTFGVMSDSVQSAKRTLLTRFRTEAATNKFWVEKLCGTQLDCIPFKSVRNIIEFESVLQSITVKDVQQLVEILNFDDSNFHSCIGVTSEQAPPGFIGNAIKYSAAATKSAAVSVNPPLSRGTRLMD